MRRVAVTVVLFASAVLFVAGCQSEHDRMVGLIKKALKKEGIQGGVDPALELTKKGDDHWTGTATFGDIVYDIRVYKDSVGKLMLERKMRVPEK